MENAVRPSAAAPPPPPPEEPDFVGRVVGDFRILRRIGKGGMGQVFLAEQLSLKRHVALKIMRPDLAANPTALRRFQLEAEAVARITHANIVQVYAYGVADGVHYIALEYVEGKNLREYLARKGTPELLVSLSIMRQVAAALQRASELGIVHRDIKPENILLTRKGEAKVTDFGLSRCLVPTEQQAVNLTQSGVALGTPLYMSPEQVQGKETDPRTDIYSFGVTCYHMLAGQPPYRGQSAIEVAIQHLQNAPTPLSEHRPDLPVELCQVVHKMMAKDPAERYQTARDLLADLVRLRESLSNQRTQGIQVSQLTAVATATPASSVKLPTPAPPSVAVPVVRRRLWPAGLVVASLLVAATAGGLLRWWQGPEKAAPGATADEGPAIATPVGEASRSDARELALREAVQKPYDARDAQRHLEQAIQLGVLYLDQRRLDEADKFFKELRDKPERQPHLAHHALGTLGQAIVLAFRGQPRPSNDLFLELEKRRPKLGSLPDLVNRDRALRRLTAEALNHNATNLAPEPLPASLEWLRRLPIQRTPDQ